MNSWAGHRGRGGHWTTEQWRGSRHNSWRLPPKEEKVEPESTKTLHSKIASLLATLVDATSVSEQHDAVREIVKWGYALAAASRREAVEEAIGREFEEICKLLADGRTEEDDAN